jgi:hypothetical protein
MPKRNTNGNTTNVASTETMRIDSTISDAERSNELSLGA